MKQSFVYQPIYFFLTTLCIGGAAWFIAAYLSYQHSLQHLLFPLIIAGMSSPSIAAFIMFAQSKDKNFWNDFCERLRFTKIKLKFIPTVLLLMPCLILLAITISLLFGFSSDQFSLSQLDKILEGKNLLAIVFIVILSCSLEEIGWRGYGIDSLRSSYNLWQTSLIFALIWSLWHVPAFFINNGYFQQEIWNLGFISVIIYFVSLLPITIVINWLYARNNRSIVVAIIFHSIMNLSYGLLRIQPFTKMILMVELLLVAVILVVKDKELFFNTNQ